MIMACTAPIGVRTAVCPECEFVIKAKKAPKALRKAAAPDEHEDEDGSDVDMRSQKEEIEELQEMNIDTPRARGGAVGVPRGKRICPSPGDACTVLIGIRTAVFPECSYEIRRKSSSGTAVKKYAPKRVCPTTECDLVVTPSKKASKAPKNNKGRRGKRFCPNCEAQVPIRLAVCRDCNHRFGKTSSASKHITMAARVRT